MIEVQTPEMAAIFNRGLKYVKKNPGKAVSLFKEFIRKYGENKEVWLNLSVAYKSMNDYANCGECLLKAVDEKMPYSDGKLTKYYGIGLNNLGLLAHTFQREEEAERYFLTALEDGKYTSKNALWNLSVSRLRRICSGDGTVDWDDAWKLYDYRFKRDEADPLRNTKENLEYWNFRDRVDSMVVLAEQGFGDLLMFGRYLEFLKDYTDKIWVQCDEAIDGIFKDAGYITCRRTDETDANHGIPIGSLPKMMPYIPKGDWLKEFYKPRVREGALRIACVWEGNRHHVNDKNRSITPFFFNRLRKYGELYTIGIGKPEPGFKHLPVKTWNDTIKQLEEVDLVISIDTSIVHMCGALGKPCWVMMPKVDSDFRWGLDSMGYKNVWYDSVTVIRNPNDWVKTFDHICALLEVLNANNK